MSFNYETFHFDSLIEDRSG